MSDWAEAERHVERAHELYEAGRWRDAEQELREALALNPYRADWHFNLGLTLEADGRWSDAAAAYRAAHELEPADDHTLLVLGSACLRADLLDEALDCLTRVNQRQPDDPEPCVHLIEVYGRLGRHDEAEVMFYRALQDEGDHALAYANIAESFLDKNDSVRALDCLRQAAAIDPTLPRIHARLALAHARAGRKERARQLYLRELRDNPGDLDTLLDLGCLLAEMGRSGEASEKFRRVLELEPTHAEARYHLADLAIAQHRHEHARGLLEQTLDCDADYPGARRLLARLDLRKGDLAGARRLLRRDMRRLRTIPREFTDEDLEELGELLLDVRLPQDAERVFGRLVARQPGSHIAWRLLAVSRFKAGRRAAGQAACRRALRIKADDVASLHNLALSLIQDRRWGAARAVVRRALQVDPDDVQLRRLDLTIRFRQVVRMLRRVVRGRAGAANAA
jgi:tetratricopeptide (TPR) repeat protein